MTDQQRFVVKVNGSAVSTPLVSRQAAENFIQQLSECQQGAAIVVPVTNNGQEILLG